MDLSRNWIKFCNSATSMAALERIRSSAENADLEAVNPVMFQLLEVQQVLHKSERSSLLPDELQMSATDEELQGLWLSAGAFQAMEEPDTFSLSDCHSVNTLCYAIMSLKALVNKFSSADEQTHKETGCNASLAALFHPRSLQMLLQTRPASWGPFTRLYKTSSQAAMSLLATLRKLLLVAVHFPPGACEDERDVPTLYPISAIVALLQPPPDSSMPQNVTQMQRKNRKRLHVYAAACVFPAVLDRMDGILPSETALMRGNVGWFPALSRLVRALTETRSLTHTIACRIFITLARVVDGMLAEVLDARQ
ncbi:hypothetical protein WJX72_002995 [[Myrmecia] bisecta]|uniref:Uncharacterized protein n=1 Tax=[Myrmecia] bisecta TaxID=41462 RepID=A0AAW1P9M7_9CHLO